MDRQFWNGKRVLVTGHTGFKGGWLVLWLARMGAKVSGFALRPPSEPNLFTLANVGEQVDSTTGDVGDLAAVVATCKRTQPELIFHLAAQSLVRKSYAEPVQTYRTNVMGTVHVLEAARAVGSVRAIVNVTSDKCYENREVPWGYRETDPLGGADPYSSSKGCSELVAGAYRRSYFSKSGQTGLASVRAGNVIGGGDWAEDRLVPDCIRAFLQNEPIVLRNPSAVRPWQHVLDPLAGYLMVAERLYENPASLSGAYNFGPYEHNVQPVSMVVGEMARLWGETARVLIHTDAARNEAGILALDSTLARTHLGWKPRLGFQDALQWTIGWYRAYDTSQPMAEFTATQIADFETRIASSATSEQSETPVDPSPSGRK